MTVVAMIASAGCYSGTPASAPTFSGSTTGLPGPGFDSQLPESAPALDELGRRHSDEESDAADRDHRETNDPGEAGSAFQGDWPDFRNGPDLRGIATSGLPDQLELIWEVPTRDGVPATAAIVDGRVYLGVLSGDVLCLELADGSEVWNYRSIESTDPEEFAPGFVAPATVSDAAVFIGDEDGVVHALGRETGEQLWTFPTGGLIKGGVTLLSGDRVMVGSQDGYLYCLDAQSGEEVWRCETFGTVNGSQAFDGQFTFVTGCETPVLRVVDVETGEQHAEVPLDGLLIASPALAGDVLYFGTPDGDVMALHWQEQHTIWTWSDRQRAQKIDSTPAVTEDLVLIGSGDRRLHAIDRETGEERWYFETRGAVDSSPVVVGDRVFFGSADHNLYGVRISDAAEVFRYDAGKRITASPAVGDGRLVIGTEGRGGRILCFGEKE